MSRGRDRRKDADSGKDDVELEDTAPGTPFAHLLAGRSPGAQREIARRMQTRRGGEQLDPGMRSRAEKSLGSPLGDVRVHQGAEAAQANEQMGSKAFAIGNNIVLGASVANSANPILAHEVAHAAQQRGADPGVAPKLERDAPASAHERDADQAADRMMLGIPARVSQLGAPRVQCFDSYEHKALGDKGGGGQTVMLDCGVELSYGEVVAMSGDFYGSPEKLMKAPKAEVLALRDQIKTQKREADGNPDGKPNKQEGAANEKAFEKITQWREQEESDKDGKQLGTKGALKGTEDKSYTSLAKENKDHFSPRNMEMQYAPEHEKALALAAQAFAAQGEEKTRLLNEAFLHDGFACHFLTDAFASGHLVSGDYGREIGQAFYKAHHVEIFEALTNAVMEDQHAARDQAATEVAAIMGFAEGQCASLCLKLVHDLLNESGLEVQNKRGDVWQTKGDDNLASAPRTQELASEAVRVSREDIDRAAKTGQSPADWKATKLVPELIGYKGQVYTIHEFTRNPLIFERYLRPLLLDRSKNNPLYQLVKGNLGFAGVVAEEDADKYGRKGLAEARKIKAGENNAYDALGKDVERGVNAVGRGMKKAGHAVADFATGDKQVAEEEADMQHDMMNKGITPAPRFRR